MKAQTTTSSVPLYGSVVGFVFGILISAVFGFLASREISSVLFWAIFLGIFTGPLGAVVGAYVATYWQTTGPERKKLIYSLLPKLGGVVGFILGFWIPAATIYIVLVQQTYENMVPGIFNGVCAGVVIAPLGAVGGIYLAKHLLKAWSKEEGSN